MLDPLKGLLTHGLDILALGWAAFSPAALGLGALGLGLAALCLFGCAALGWLLPDFVKRWLVISGLALIVGAGLWQASRLKAMHDAYEIATAAALAAEATRAERAERIAADIAAQAATDHAALLRDNEALHRLTDELQRDRAHARACIGRALARRLRQL